MVKLVVQRFFRGIPRRQHDVGVRPVHKLDAVRPAHTAGFGAADDLPHQTDLQRGKMGNCSFQHPLREIGKALVQPVQLPFENRHQIFRFKIVVPWLHQIGVLPQ